MHGEHRGRREGHEGGEQRGHRRGGHAPEAWAPALPSNQRDDEQRDRREHRGGELPLPRRREEHADDAEMRVEAPAVHTGVRVVDVVRDRVEVWA